MGGILGIVSGKGGVGKTTVTSNVGVSLAKDFNIKTCVLDCNVLTSNLGLHLGLIHVPITLHDIFTARLGLDKATYVHSSGLYVIPSSLSLGTEVELENLKKLIQNELVEQYEMIFLDSAPGLSQEALAVIHAVDDVIVVTNPELPAVTDALKSIDIAEKFGKKIRGVVLNKITGSDYELTVSEVERTCGYQVIAEIPFDKKVPKSIAMRAPVVVSFPKSPAAKALRGLAGYIAGRDFGPSVPKRVGIIQRIKYVILGRT